jgi:excisionase family DNA binding protein
MENEKSLLRVTEFAALLDVTPACIRRWLLERKISSVRIGRLVRIPREEATQLIDHGFRPRVQGGRGVSKDKRKNEEVEKTRWRG